MKSKFTFILFVLIGVSSISNASVFTDALQKYCVPKSANGCSSNLKANYNESLSGNNKCECSSCGMYYDMKERGCKVCPLGTFVNNRNSTECIQISCGVNSYMDVMTNSCPVNFYKEAASTCK